MRAKVQDERKAEMGLMVKKKKKRGGNQTSALTMLYWTHTHTMVKKYFVTTLGHI